MTIRILQLFVWLSIAFAATAFAQNGRGALNTPISQPNTNNNTLPTPAEQGGLYSQVVVVVEDILDPYSINIYPNPANEVLYVEVNTPSQISLRTSLGEVLYQTLGEGRVIIDTSTYPNGIYYVVVQNAIALPTPHRVYIIHRY